MTRTVARRHCLAAGCIDSYPTLTLTAIKLRRHTGMDAGIHRPWTATCRLLKCLLSIVMGFGLPSLDNGFWHPCQNDEYAKP